ncbi:FKBP-type peptidyl-prolyl cis-trans isomerase ASCRUDRAFT_72765 [Ascoidea rubescens DSM 1968]|uniref:peptidylprolyl isomerase n=1 Tax=Ascoidea rubescens DSM 1968 TaxID=1344418 RepID=A0A1D2V9P4_9ASCO|nr:hypothetical protein ASCRUDRAFT_72765 [Ascoidea rubescens DSM 1968]ODV58358.1 hypothetical protein ASCRUDRAFT_72765 [Ascoidea rubescens DSM 1968]
MVTEVVVLPSYTTISVCNAGLHGSVHTDKKTLSQPLDNNNTKIDIDNKTDDELIKLIQIERIHPGDNKHFPTKDSIVQINYTGYFTNGKKFDSSFDRNQPFSYKIGSNYVIKAWELIIPTLSLHEKIRIFIPNQLAYGEKGFPGYIPPNKNLIFDIELINISYNLDNNNCNDIHNDNYNYISKKTVFQL